MELSGQTVFRVSRDRLARALRDPEMLRLMIPGCREMKRLSDTEFEARIDAAAGPVTFRLSPRVMLEPVSDGRYVLRAQGRSAIAGAVEVRLALALLPVADGTCLTHQGTLTATGLAGKLLRGREEMLRERTETMFRQLRDAMEAEGSARV